MNDFNEPIVPDRVQIEYAMSTLSSTTASMIANVTDADVRATLIRLAYELHDPLAIGLGAKPLVEDDRERIDAHIEYMTDYVNNLRKLYDKFNKADKASNN